MGSSTKKHKKDRDLKKHKHRSRSKSSDVEIIHDSRDTTTTIDEKESSSISRSSGSGKHRHHHHHHHHQHQHHIQQNRQRSNSNVRYRSRSKSKSRSPLVHHHDDDYNKAKEYDRERRHHHKKHKERKHKHRSITTRSPVREIDGGRNRNDYHSDSSDVIEVPPAPIISKKTKSHTKSPSPIPENGAGDCLSIEQTNKLRAKLGLKPLEIEPVAPAPPSISLDNDDGKNSNYKNDEKGLNSFKDEWGEFLHKPADNLAEKAEAEKLREKFKQRKEKRALEEKLKRVKGLGESDDEIDNTKAWIMKNREKDELKKEAERRAKILEEMDEEFGVGDLVEQEKRKRRDKVYKDRDLKGLRVEHDIEEFKEGKEIILTLKDKDVLADDDDTLVNVNLMDEERYKKNIENKKQRPDMYGYNVYDEEYDEYGNPIDRGILGKYDDEIHGDKKKKSFTIGQNIEEERIHQRKLLEIKSKLAGKKLESLQELGVKLASDTFTETELEKFKKPKKKIKKLRQKLKAEDLIPLTDTTVSSNRDLGSRHNKKNATITSNSIITTDIQPSNTRKILQTDDTIDTKLDLSDVKVEIEDEDELQKVLAKARKLKQKENIIRKPLPIDPNEIKTEIKTEPDNDDEMNGDSGIKDGHIVLNATAEFCRTLGDIPTYGMAGNREEDSLDEMMDFEQETEPIKEEPIINTGQWNSVNPDLVTRVLSGDENSNDVSDIAILDEEPDVGSGVAAALRLAMSKGYLEKEDKNRPSNSRMAHLQAKNYSIEDKNWGDEDKFGRRDRYHSGPIMDFKEKDTFKPNVKLEYIDDNGRILNAKEAFRYLSHKFHGKGPGKNKIEKRLKKMEQEGLMKKMSSTDTPLGTLSMLQQKQRETHTPYVILSGSKQTQTTTTIAKHK